jgi:hypothetical protein
LFSRGVPLMGTRAFTGNDSGCSDILRAPRKAYVKPLGKAWNALGGFPDETDTIGIRFA